MSAGPAVTDLAASHLTMAEVEFLGTLASPPRPPPPSILVCSNGRTFIPSFLFVYTNINVVPTFVHTCGGGQWQSRPRNHTPSLVLLACMSFVVCCFIYWHDVTSLNIWCSRDLISTYHLLAWHTESLDLCSHAVAATISPHAASICGVCAIPPAFSSVFF